MNMHIQMASSSLRGQERSGKMSFFKAETSMRNRSLQVNGRERWQEGVPAKKTVTLKPGMCPAFASMEPERVPGEILCQRAVPRLRGSKEENAGL